jgi:hypothetical protein
MKKPDETEYAPHYKIYIDSIEPRNAENLLEFLSTQVDKISSLISGLSKDEANYRYAEGKWTIKELLGHIADSERIFSYRLLCVARGEKKSLLAYDEDSYAKNGNFSKRSVKSLVDEFTFLRKSLLLLIENFDEEIFNRRGLANNKEVTVRALFFIIAGHTQHHINILKEKYLKK